MSNESNNLRTAEYEVAVHIRTNMHTPTRALYSQSSSNLQAHIFRRW